jgi:D-xylose transport system permease protein
MTTVEVQQSRAKMPGARSLSLGEHIRDYFRRVWGGEMGALPAIVGLLVLCIAFSLARPKFFTAGNFANLFTQGAAVTVIAMGLVFVLLLGEIDLSAGFASGVAACVMSVLLVRHHVNLYLSLGSAIVTGLVIGLVLGTLVAKVGIPSFVVTLAAFLAFQGLALRLLGDGQVISVADNYPVIYALENKNMPLWLGWLMLAVGVVGFAAVQLVRVRNRVKRGLPRGPLSLVVLRVGALTVLGAIAVYFLNVERSPNPPYHVGDRVLGVSLRGIPVVVPVIVVLLVVWTFVLARTSYGRHLYAVGGSKEAARRAGINVDRIRVSAFVICSSMAAIGGIIAVSRANSVDSNTGGSNVLLYAVGAAVIGGTSLFGGKGRVLDAILGGAVIAVIDNGMGLMGYKAGTKFIVTGVFLLAAAGLDALMRKRAAATGLR